MKDSTLLSIILLALAWVLLGIATGGIKVIIN